MQKNENIDKKIPATTRDAGYISNIKVSNLGGITRKIYLKAWRYNMHLVPRNMLIELGAQTNTVEEIMNTVEILAFTLNKVLSGQ